MVEISREIDRKVAKPTSPYAPKQNQFQIKSEKKPRTIIPIFYPTLYSYIYFCKFYLVCRLDNAGLKCCLCG